MNTVNSNYGNEMESGAPAKTNPATSTYKSESIVSEDVEKQYRALMNDMLERLKKNPPSEEDSRQIQADLKALLAMQNGKPGLETGMNHSIDAILVTLSTTYSTLTDGGDFLSNDCYFPPNLLSIALNSSTGNEQAPTIRQMLETLINQAVKSKAGTLTEGDLALVMAKEGYQLYMDQLKGLNDQLKIAKDINAALTDLRNILNQLTPNSPASFPIPPTSWDQLPPDLQERLKAQGITTIEGINKNYDAFVKTACDYFSQEMGWTTNPGNFDDSMNKVIASRDNLQKQLDLLAASGADKEDSNGAYATTKKVLDDLNARFPPDKYPPGTTFKTEQGITGYHKKFEKGNWVDDKDHPICGPVTTAYGPDGKTPLNIKSDDIKKDLILFINSGQVKNTGISDLITNAINANQTLSTKAADKIKALDAWLQQLFDMLSAVADADNKAVAGAARAMR